MRIPQSILGLAIILLSVNAKAQDEGYTNERRNSGIEDGLFHYSIGYSTDFGSRERLTIQGGRTPLSNFTFGGSFILTKTALSTNDFGFGIGLYLKNHFLHGRVRPFVEPQVSIMNPGYYGKHFEVSAAGGASWILTERQSPLYLDLFGQYYGPFGSFEEKDEAFIFSLRFGGYF